MESSEKPCQIWTGAYTQNGYPVRNGSLVRREVVIERDGSIPADMIVMDTCGNRGCTEPSHLFIGSQADRMRAYVDAGLFDGGHLDRQPTYEERARGERVSTAKLTAEDIPVIRSRARNGELHREIALDYGVSRPAISYVVRGETWAHIPDLMPTA